MGWDIQGEKGGVGLRVNNDCLVEHDGCKCRVEVEALFHALDNSLPSNSPTISRQDTVIGKRIHHGAGAANCMRGDCEYTNLRGVLACRTNGV
jgi:hypothetical protein